MITIKRAFMRLADINTIQQSIRPLDFISDQICTELHRFSDLNATRTAPESCKQFLETLLCHTEAINNIPADPVAILDIKMAYVLASKVGGKTVSGHYTATTCINGAAYNIASYL